MSDFGDELVEAMGQALAHARGEAVPGTIVHRVAVLDADAVRAIPAAIDLISRREKVVLDMCKRSDFNIAALREALSKADEIH